MVRLPLLGGLNCEDIMNPFWVDTYLSKSGGWNGTYGFNSYLAACQFMNSYRYTYAGSWTVLSCRPVRKATDAEMERDCRRLLLPGYATDNP
jgi:hypothetical protein